MTKEPIVMHLCGSVFWRGPDGKDFIYWRRETAEAVLERFERNGWTDLSEPLRKAIDEAKRFQTSKRFFEKVEPLLDGCHAWAGAVSASGYGHFWVEGSARTAHRVAYELSGREIPKGMFLLHKCDRPICVNPDHLRPGTNADNMRDMALKGRGVGRSNRTVCPFGHPIDGVKGTRGGSNKQRYCLACNRNRTAAAKARKATQEIAA